MKLSARNQFKGTIVAIDEGAVIRDAVRIIGTGRYQIIDIDLTGEVAESDGMVCGGTMQVLVEDAAE